MIVNEALDQLPPSQWKMSVTHRYQDGVAVLELSTRALPTLYHPPAISTARHAMDRFSKNNTNSNNQLKITKTKRTTTITKMMILQRLVRLK